MKVSVVTSPGETQVVDMPKPTVGPADVLVKIRACGICGTDALFISMGGIPGHDGDMPSPALRAGGAPRATSRRARSSRSAATSPALRWATMSSSTQWRRRAGSSATAERAAASPNTS